MSLSFWILIIAIVGILIWLDVAFWELARQDVDNSKQTIWYRIARWPKAQAFFLRQRPFIDQVIRIANQAVKKLGTIGYVLRQHPLVGPVVTRANGHSRLVALTDFIKSHLFIITIIILGFLAARYGHIIKYKQIHWANLAQDFYEGYFADILAIAITVFAIDRLNRNRDSKRNDEVEIRFLINQARSEDRIQAADAIRLLAQRKWLKKADLTNTNLSECNLSNIDLRYIDFSHTNFTGTNLSQADLTGSTLIKANLTRADLSDATLVDSDLSDADVHHAKFKGADISGATMKCIGIWKAELWKSIYSKDTEWLDNFEYWNRKALGPESDLAKVNFRNDKPLVNLDLRKANLINADLTDAVLIKSKLQEANLAGAKLENTNLDGTDLTDAVLEGATYNSETKWPEGFDYRNCGAFGPKANFSGTNLKEKEISGLALNGADFSDATLVKTKLYETDLSNADLRDAKLNSAYMNKAILTGAQLAGTDLSAAYLKGANLSEVKDLDEAKLKHARYDEDTLWPDGFDYQNCDAFGPKTNLRNKDLQNVKIFDADLSDADLRGANLTGAQLEMTKLFNADLRGAHLDNANLLDARYDDDTKWPHTIDENQLTLRGAMKVRRK